MNRSGGSVRLKRSAGAVLGKACGVWWPGSFIYSKYVLAFLQERGSV